MLIPYVRDIMTNREYLVTLNLFQGQFDLKHARVISQLNNNLTKVNKTFIRRCNDG